VFNTEELQIGWNSRRKKSNPADLPSLIRSISSVTATRLFKEFISEGGTFFHPNVADFVF
jgi:hypothetical protein